MPVLHFWFDFVSPYSYLAHCNTLTRILPAFPSVQVQYHPIVFGAVLSHHGLLGPAEIPTKREALFRDVHRTAKKESIVLGQPKTHPFKSVDALRVATPGACTLETQRAVVDGLFRAAWQENFKFDLSRPEDLRRALETYVPDVDVDALIAESKTAEVKDALRAATDEAISRGVFGVPTFSVDEREYLWGNDKVGVVLDILAGRNVLTEEDEKFIGVVLKTGGVTRAKK